MGLDKVPRAAYVVDVDEDSGQAIRGSRRSASTREAEKPKVSHREKEPRPNKTKRRTKDDPERERQREHKRDLEVITTERQISPLQRRQSTSGGTLSPHKIVRPPSAHKNRSFPRLPENSTRRDDPSHFGVPPTPTGRALPVVSQPPIPQTMPQPIPVRPRATTAQTYPVRPVSYHATYNAAGGYGPPLSASAWTNYQPPQTMVATGYGAVGYPHRYAATPAPPASDYFGSQAMSAPDRPMSARPLSSRFDPLQRKMSGFGNHDNASAYEPSIYENSYHDDGYASASEGTVRRRESIRKPSRPSTRRLSKIEADNIAMPPPPRPILRRPAPEYPTEFIDPYREGRTLIRDDSRPRQSSSHRNSVTYDLGPERDTSRPRRSVSSRNSGSYEVSEAPERVRIETANKGRRRQSYYGQSASASGSSGFEDKIRQATSYQEDVAGPSMPLTAEVLKRQQRRQAGSSRSTKSSNSRDESDYRKSATTRTTRSGSGPDDENVTIKVVGTARVMVGGAQIDCPDGGEIEIKRQPKALRNGSEISGSEFGGQAQIDDRRSRVDRPSGRSRLSSQHSYTRSTQYFGDNYF